VKEGAAKFGFPLPAEFVSKPVDLMLIGTAVVALLVILWAVWQSKRESPEMSAMHSELTD